MHKKSWMDFRETGMLWFINSILHVFGWSIVIEVVDGSVVDVYPARSNLRGFSEKDNDKGYLRMTEYMKRTSDQLYEEVREHIDEPFK